MTYDFLLFENNRYAINHYKDVEIIAHLLKAQGYNVAILNVGLEDTLCNDPSIPHLNVSKKLQLIDETDKSGLALHLTYVINMIKWHFHLRRSLLEVKRKYKRLYVGSYTNKMGLAWIAAIDNNSEAFFWGLRLFWLSEYKRKVLSFEGVNSFFLSKYFYRHKNLKFFVSNELIKEEFRSIGYGDNRLVVREERVADSIGIIHDHKCKSPIFLTIGTLRPDKRVDICIKEFKKLPQKYKASYVIAGKTSGDYELKITDEISNSDNIIRKNYRIPEDEYNKLFEDADFLLLCDVKQQSSVTNGTMNEALLKGIPIIAPKYNPYDFYITKYGIGLLFDPSIEGDMARIMEMALAIGKSSFNNNILKYQETLSFESVSRKLKENIEAVYQ